MNKRESIDVESAYGSEVFSNSGFSTKKETFTLEEPTSKQQVWYQWLKCKLREYMVLEAVFFLILVVLLINSYRITSQNEKILATQTMILTLQSQFNSFQKPTSGKDVMNLKEETEEVMGKENEEMKEMMEVLKEVKTKINIPTPLFSNVNTANTSPVSNADSTSSLTRFNAASLIEGASIDTPLSSSSNLNPTFRFDQSSLVLVDRPVPPANKAWCTYEKEPVLTVNLAKYVKPTSVSYQHSKWHGVIPDEAPKIYDVVRCLDYYCEKLEPLVSNCTYRSLLSNIQEQECQITGNISSPIGKIQFRFRKNQGSTERTCVSLIRVYAETDEIPKVKERSLEDAKTCSDLKYNYHHMPFIYNKLYQKSCTVLYSKGCCTECPECCEECEVRNLNEREPIIVFCIAFSLFVFLLAITFLCVCLCA